MKIVGASVIIAGNGEAVPSLQNLKEASDK